MFQTNLRKYVTDISPIFSDKKFQRKLIIGALLFALISGIVPGFQMKEYWLFIACVMIFIAVIGTISVFVITAKSLDLKLILFVSSINVSVWIILLSLSELLFFTYWKGFHIELLLLFIPLIVIPIAESFRVSHLLKKSEYKTREFKTGKSKPISFFGGLSIIYLIKALFHDVDQDKAMIILLVAAVILNSFFSFGFLIIQKLIYCIKYKISN